MNYLTKAQYANADARDYSLFCYRTYSANKGISVVTQITRRIRDEFIFEKCDRRKNAN